MRGQLYLLIGLVAVLIGITLTTPRGLGGGGIDARDLEDVAFEAIDELMDSGLIAPRPAYDDPVFREQRVIWLVGTINHRMAQEITSRLLYLDGLSDSPIDLYISTSGGNTGDALLIADVMQRMRAPVNTWASGICASAGVKVLVAGTGRRRALPNARIDMHVIRRSDREGRKAEANFWRAYTKLNADRVANDGENRFYSLDEALQFGIIDEVVPRKERPKR